ncbi:MAG: hypothetical protein ACXWHA_06655, partial [Usitatibacter sp.]
MRDAFRVRLQRHDPDRRARGGQVSAENLSKNIVARQLTPGVGGLRFLSRGGSPLAAEEKKRKEFE